MNYFSGRGEKRGYYLHVSPVEITERENGIVCTSYSMFSGIKECVLECERKSKRQEQCAEQMADRAMINKLLKHILDKNKLVLEDKERMAELYPEKILQIA